MQCNKSWHYNTTIRTAMALVAAEDMQLELLDIKTAFLNGTLQEEVYLKHPPEYHRALQGQCCC